MNSSVSPQTSADPTTVFAFDLYAPTDNGLLNTRARVQMGYEIVPANVIVPALTDTIGRAVQWKLSGCERSEALKIGRGRCALLSSCRDAGKSSLERIMMEDVRKTLRNISCKKKNNNNK